MEFEIKKRLDVYSNIDGRPVEVVFGGTFVT